MNLFSPLRSGFATLADGMASIFEGMASIVSAGTASSSYRKFNKGEVGSFSWKRTFTATRDGETVHITDSELDEESNKMLDETMAGFETDMDTMFKDFDRSMDTMFKDFDRNLDAVFKRADIVAQRASEAAEKARKAAASKG